MDMMFFLSVLILLIGGISIFTRLPIVSGFTFFGFAFFSFMAFLAKGAVLDSTIVLFVFIIATLSIVLQLLMNVDLEKEFQKIYKKNITPVAGMIFVAFFLGAVSLVLYSAEKKGELPRTTLKEDLSFEFAAIFIITILVLFCVTSLVGMFGKNDR